MKAMGLLYLSSLCGGSDLQQMMEEGELGHLFNPSEKEAFDFVKQHILKHGVIPAPETVEVECQVELPESKEPPGYYLDHMRQRFLDRGFRDAVQEAGDLLKGKNADPRGAVDSMMHGLTELMMHDRRATLHDFRAAHDPVMAEYTALKKGETNFGVGMGWPTLDAMLGGLRKGDFASIVGRPQKGKTWQMLYCAHHAWEKQGKVPMFVTLEMKAPMIRQRLAALHGHVPAMDLKLADLTKAAEKKLITKLESAATAEKPFWIVDAGMAATVPDLLAMAQLLKPDCIYVDGAYLLRHENSNLTRFRRVDECADQMKHMLCEVAPTIASYQFNRKASKGKDDKGTGDDVYGSDVIFQNSSLMLGLHQPDTAENVHRKLITIEKGRGGEQGEFWVNWRFNQMNFEECDPEQDTSYVLEHVG